LHWRSFSPPFSSLFLHFSLFSCCCCCCCLLSSFLLFLIWVLACLLAFSLSSSLFFGFFFYSFFVPLPSLLFVVCFSNCILVSLENSPLSLSLSLFVPISFSEGGSFNPVPSVCRHSLVPFALVSECFFFQLRVFVFPPFFFWWVIL
jgi:hypothetical protein